MASHRSCSCNYEIRTRAGLCAKRYKIAKKKNIKWNLEKKTLSTP